MFIDFRTLEGATIIKSDLCIIGAGAAGITIARKFIGSKVQVCLVESGGLEFERETQSLYQGDSVGLPRVNLDSCRQRFFGGTTNHWGGWSAPLNEIDFKRRPWVPYSGWPLSLSDLEPYYETAQKVCGLGPNIYDERLWPYLGINYPRLDLDRAAIRFWQINPLRFGEVYREELEKAENIHVLLHSNVTNVQTNKGASNVEHIDVQSLEGRKGIIKAKTFILACGGIEIPRLLLLSNRVESTGLGNRYDLVGRFFMDHPPMDNPPPPVRCGFIITDDSKGIMELFRMHEHDGVRYLPSIYINEETQRREKITNCTTWLNFDSGLAYNDPPKNRHDVSENDFRINELGENLWRVARELDNERGMAETPNASGSKQLVSHRLKYIDIVAQFEQVPNPDSRITLSYERDALGLNRVRVNWNMTAQDKHTVRVMSKMIATEFSRLNFGRVRLEEWLLDRTPDWPIDLQGAWHHTGTTRMSDNPKVGVVDKHCKVHGIENLYIASCSVFPTSGYVNPTLTIVALALRLADHVKNLKRY